jgi:hypothetical protein
MTSVQRRDGTPSSNALASRHPPANVTLDALPAGRAPTGEGIEQLLENATEADEGRFSDGIEQLPDALNELRRGSLRTDTRKPRNVGSDAAA